MKKRGFTLIELIAVVAILMIVFLVASPVLKTLIQNNGKTEKELIEERVLVAAKEYANTYSSNFYDNLIKEGDYNYIYKSDLLSSGLIDSDDMSKLPNLLGVKGEVYNKDKVRYTLQYIDNNTPQYSYDEVYAMLEALTNRVTNVEGSVREGVGITALDIYPIGSIYTSIQNIDPGALFGGTWVRFGKGKTLVSVDEDDTSFDTVEKTGGEKAHTLTSAELPSHTHSIPALSGTAASNGAHTHTVSTTASTSGSTGGGGSHTHGVSNTYSSRGTSGAGSHSHTLNKGVPYGMPYNDTTGDFTSKNSPNEGVGMRFHESYSPFSIAAVGDHTHTVTDYYANTTSGGTTLTVNQIPSHTHTIPALSGTAASAGDHTHTVTTTASTTESTGSGNAHNNLQPYITVYMWKRTG